MSIQVKNIEKHFRGAFHALKNILAFRFSRWSIGYIPRPIWLR